MRIFTLLMLFFSTISYAQEVVPKNQIVIRDVVGDVEVRSTSSSTWSPLTAGRSVSISNFIRLNTKDSSVTITYPDGGTLRLLGLGSFYFEEISFARKNIYHNKILVFSGRWFFQANTNNPTRFIANTDITTSVVEQGSGGGLFTQGTTEFILLMGRGLISYRQKGVNAIVLDERQFVNFNIFEGFFQPKVLTDIILEQYMILPTTSIQTVQYSKNTQEFSYDSTPYLFASRNAVQKKTSLKMLEIQSAQSSLLQDLQFPRRKDRVQGTIVSVNTNNTEIDAIFQNLTPRTNVIPQALLESINVEDFEITVKPPVEEPTNIVPETTPTPRPTRRRRATPVLARTNVTPNEEITVTPTQVAKPKLDIESLINQIGENFSEEQADLETPTAVSQQPRIRIQEQVIPEDPPEIIEPIVEEAPLPPPVIEVPPSPPTPIIKRRVVRKRVPRPTPPPPPVVEVVVPPAPAPRRRPVVAPAPTVAPEPVITESPIPPVEEVLESLAEEEVVAPPVEEPAPIPSDRIYRPSDSFFNRDLSSDAYKNSVLQLDSIDDLLDSDLSILLLR